MDESQPWRRAKELFALALHRTGPDRASFLAEACGADTALRAQVESLLAESDAGSPPDGAAAATPPTTS
jgi:hypothetical protein